MNHQTRLISIHKVCDIAGLSKTEIYKRMSNNSFPKSVQLSSKCVRWAETEIYDWIRQQLESRVVN